MRRNRLHLRNNTFLNDMYELLSPAFLLPVIRNLSQPWPKLLDWFTDDCIQVLPEIKQHTTSSKMIDSVH